MMKLYYIFLILISVNCNSQTTNEFNPNLDDCMSKQDLIELEKAVKYFEKQLIKMYNPKNINEAYFSHLEDFYNGNFDEERFNFFMDKGALGILENLKNSKTFDKIWISLSTAVSELKDENGEPILNDPDNKKVIIINKYGDYQKCVKAATRNSAIIDYINFEINNPGFSIHLSARNLHQRLRAKDFDNDLIKLVITLGFYYEYIFWTNKQFVE